MGGGAGGRPFAHLSENFALSLENFALLSEFW